MVAVIRATLAFAGMEMRRFLRSTQLWTHVLGPFLGGPTLLFLVISQLVTSPLATMWLSPPVRVALSPDHPVELDVPATLEDDDCEIIFTHDPVAVFEAGDADVAVIAWRQGDGLGTQVDEAVGPLGIAPPRLKGRAATSWRWRATVLAHEQRDQDRVSHSLETAGDRWLEDQLAIYDIEAAAAERPWMVHTLRPLTDATPPDASVSQSVLLMIAIFIAVCMTQLQGVLPLSDRRDGLVETWQATATPPVAILLGRMLASVTLITVLITLGLVGVLASLPMIFEALHPGRPLTFPLTASLVFAPLITPVGLYARSVPTANNVVIVSWLVGGALLVGLMEVPPGIDVALALVLLVGTAMALVRLDALGRPLDTEAEG